MMDTARQADCGPLEAGWNRKQIEQMKTFKTRHQLFLSEELSKRLAQRAKVTGKAKSEILVEALDAWFNRRDGGRNFEALEARASGIERRIEAVGRKQGIFWEAFARMLRHQLALATVLPKPDDAGRASAARQFETFIDQMAEMLAGKEPPQTDDPAIEKLRKMH
jgi:predicted transcriptional regulator